LMAKSDAMEGGSVLDLRSRPPGPTAYRPCGLAESPP
jgi:hypothetical protein